MTLTPKDIHTIADRTHAAIATNRADAEIPVDIIRRLLETLSEQYANDLELKKYEDDMIRLGWGWQ